MQSPDDETATQDHDAKRKSARVRNGLGCALVFLGPLLAGVLTVIVLTISTFFGKPPLLQFVSDVVATIDAFVAVLAGAIGGFLFPGPMPQRVFATIACAFLSYFAYVAILSLGGPIF